MENVCVRFFKFLSVINGGHGHIPIIIQQDPKHSKEGLVVCPKLTGTMSGGYMQEYIPHLFRQSVTM